MQSAASNAAGPGPIRSKMSMTGESWGAVLIVRRRASCEYLGSALVQSSCKWLA
eukprot:COSAG01_NODE_6640_length_3566_cov_3.548443_4_plen_54_part_00